MRTSPGTSPVGALSHPGVLVRTPLAALITVAALAATPAPAAPPEPAGPGSCAASLSGGVTARFDCSVTARVEGKVLTITLTADGPVAGLRALQPTVLKVAMPVAPGTYAGAALAS